MSKEKLLNLKGSFTYAWGNTFHIETSEGCFEWKAPDYPGGDNTIRSAPSYDKWIKLQGVGFGRDRGEHYIKDYCGTEFTFVP